MTVCTKSRNQYLCKIDGVKEFVGADIIRPNVELTHIGKILENSINQIEYHYENVKAVKYSIMPDHVHIIISIMHDFETANSGRMISAPTVSTIVGSLKRYVSKNAGISLWQKSYHDRIIRSEEEFLEICDYIDNNPVNWANNKFNQNKWR